MGILASIGMAKEWYASVWFDAVRYPLLLVITALMLMASVSKGLAEDHGEPLTASLSVSPATARPGQEVELRLALTVNEPWHVFADTPGSGGQQPLRLEIKLPDGIESAADWIWPEYQSVFAGRRVNIYNAGAHVFRRKLKVIDTVGLVTFKMRMTYQCCNPEFCDAVQIVELTTDLLID